MLLTSELLNRRFVLIVLAVPALPSAAQTPALQVAAASSLAGVMPALARGFESLQPAAKLQWHSDGSGLLLDCLLYTSRCV